MEACRLCLFFSPPQSISRTPCRFFQFVRSNLHVVLMLGGPGSLALPPLTATALAQLLCHVEIYRPWSQESLVEVAQKHFRLHFKFSSKLTRGRGPP